MENKDYPRLSVRVSLDTRSYLEAKAKETGQTIGEIVKEALKKYQLTHPVKT